MFAARNAIDGVTANRSHGSWPYESWGINKREGSYQNQQFPSALNDYPLAMKQKEEQVSWHPVLQK